MLYVRWWRALPLQEARRSARLQMPNRSTERNLLRVNAAIHLPSAPRPRRTSRPFLWILVTRPKIRAGVARPSGCALASPLIQNASPARSMTRCTSRVSACGWIATTMSPTRTSPCTGDAVTTSRSRIKGHMLAPVTPKVKDVWCDSTVRTSSTSSGPLAVISSLSLGATGAISGTFKGCSSG